jgi:hypothetical protein
VVAAPTFAAHNFNPAVVNVNLQAGQSTTISKTLHLDALPGAADILIAIGHDRQHERRHRAGQGAGDAALHRRRLRFRALASPSGTSRTSLTGR